jgi:2,3,4,5-tetrahydropyridine-2-carboxylate N-succinyltransferase
MQSLKTAIERLASMGEVEQKPEARQIFLEFRDALTQGKVRAAEKHGERWVVNAWVKQGILLGFRIGELTEMGDAALSFVDKDTFPARKFSVTDRVRVVPGGSSVRMGSYVAPSVMYATHVHQRGRQGHERKDHGFARSGGIVRADRRGVHLGAAARVGAFSRPGMRLPLLLKMMCCGRRPVSTKGPWCEPVRCWVRNHPRVPSCVTWCGEVYRATSENQLPENAVVVPGSRAAKGSCGRLGPVSIRL